MNEKRILFLKTLILLTITLIITNNDYNKTSGKVTKITYSENRVIVLVNNNEYIAFTKEILSLNEKDEVEIKFKEETYKGKKEYLIQTIEKIKA